MKSALESFAMIDHPNKLAIIGDMLELGDQSTMEHKSIIDFLERQGLSGFTVGPLFKENNSPNVAMSFENRNELIEYLKSHPIKDHLILLKGSRGIGLEILEEYL
jgi:UDP-N-acetylmuramoyl-tripeptide--D-alanyl-D-alanine ligase